MTFGRIQLKSDQTFSESSGPNVRQLETWNRKAYQRETSVSNGRKLGFIITYFEAI